MLNPGWADLFKDCDKKMRHCGASLDFYRFYWTNKLL